MILMNSSKDKRFSKLNIRRIYILYESLTTICTIVRRIQVKTLVRVALPALLLII